MTSQPLDSRLGKSITQNHTYDDSDEELTKPALSKIIVIQNIT